MDLTCVSNCGLLAAAIGIATHLLYFRRGEHHMLPLVYLRLFALIYASSTILLTRFATLALPEALKTVSALATCWLAGVYGSLMIYRLFFHPLNSFPGPWRARVGDLAMCLVFKKLDGYKVLHDFHDKYGQYVRVGSNTLSVTDPRIMQSAYGMHSTVRKGDWYDQSIPHVSMHTARDKKLHDRRRRIWSPAFSDKALRDYETTISSMNSKFLHIISSSHSTPIDATTLFNLYSFDVMGHQAFGKSYGMLDSGHRHPILDILFKGSEFTGLRFPTWFSRTMIAIPGAMSGYHKFLKFCTEELRSRVQQGTKSTNNITGWLLKAYADEKRSPENDPMLQAESGLIIIAGSDTTAATLTFLFYHLAQNPSLQETLRRELQPLTSSANWTDKDIQNARHLNGTIHETLRLHPPVASGLMRKTPPEGLQIEDVFIPGDTEFFTPQYAMGRDVNISPEAESFIPERWYSKPELIKHPDAFAPFSQGPFGCIGRNLALTELRTLTARILLAYDVSFAPGEEGTKVLDETKDHFTLSPGRLSLVFAPRAE